MLQINTYTYVLKNLSKVTRLHLNMANTFTLIVIRHSFLSSLPLMFHLIPSELEEQAP